MTFIGVSSPNCENTAESINWAGTVSDLIVGHGHLLIRWIDHLRSSQTAAIVSHCLIDTDKGLIIIFRRVSTLYLQLGDVCCRRYGIRIRFRIDI